MVSVRTLSLSDHDSTNVQVSLKKDGEQNGRREGKEE
jgi:hypothetical protein